MKSQLNIFFLKRVVSYYEITFLFFSFFLYDSKFTCVYNKEKKNYSIKIINLIIQK